VSLTSSHARAGYFGRRRHRAPAPKLNAVTESPPSCRQRRTSRRWRALGQLAIQYTLLGDDLMSCATGSRKLQSRFRTCPKSPMWIPTCNLAASKPI